MAATSEAATYQEYRNILVIWVLFVKLVLLMFHIKATGPEN
jgi:hypothetical protein